MLKAAFVFLLSVSAIAAENHPILPIGSPARTLRCPEPTAQFIG